MNTQGTFWEKRKKDKNEQDPRRDQLSRSIVNLASNNRLLQCSNDVSHEIRLIFHTTADTNEIVKYTGGFALLLWNTTVRHSTGDFNEGLDTTERLCKRKDLGSLAEALSSGMPALDAERQHTTAHTVAVLLECDGVLRVRLEARVVDRDDMLRSLEGFSDARRVLRCFAGAQVESLEAAVGEPAVEGRGDGANGILEEGKALVELLGVEGCGPHDHV